MTLLKCIFLIHIFLSPWFSQKFSPAGGCWEAPLTPNRPSISALKIKDTGRPKDLTAVKSVYVRCAKAHRLISLLSIRQWLIVSKRLGTQVVEDHGVKIDTVNLEAEFRI